MSRCNFCQGQLHQLLYRLRKVTVVKCRKCNLVFLKPLVQEELAALYDKRYFYQELEKYFLYYNRTTAEAKKFQQTFDKFKAILAQLKKVNGKCGKLLDVGCGPGIFLDLARRAGWEVEGVDISEFASQYARERLGLPVRTSQFTTARYPEETFNVITMLDFLEHVPDPYQVLKKAWRIMKPGGTLVVLTPEHNSLGNKILALSYKIGFSLPLNYFYRVHHNYYFTQKNLQFILNKIGFKITLIEQRSENIDAFRCSWILKLPLKLLSSLARLLKMEDRVLVYARK